MQYLRPFFRILPFLLIISLYLLTLPGCTPLYPETEESIRKSSDKSVKPEISETGKDSIDVVAVKKVVAPLRIGVTDGAPPLVSKKGKKFVGLEVDLARALAATLGKKALFIEVPWAEQINWLEQNKIDIIMSGMTITRPRTYRVNFTTPYLRGGQIMLVRLEDRNLFSTGVYSVMNTNHTIGVVTGTTGDLFVTESINGAKIRRFEKAGDGVRALEKKKIDVLIYDAPMVCHYAAISQGQKLTPILHLATEEYLAWGVAKDNDELHSRANRFLMEIEKNGRLQRLITKWIPYM
ncbi:MAG: transporter substrate-binding domain-containing protein [Thermodesulfobacteriota bacterium]